jgi:SET domain-containing protein
MASKKLKPPKVDRSFIVVKSSPIHGKGVFVVKPIKKGQVIIEYKGERISWKLAEKRQPYILFFPR